jgi:hypothetical protein
MTDENNAMTGIAAEASQSAKQINVQMHWAGNTGQPVYSNFATTNAAQGIVIVDFGFIDPGAVNTVNQALKSGEKISQPLDAKLTFRISLNPETAQKLSQQLSQVLTLGSVAATPVAAGNESNATATKETGSSVEKPADQAAQKSESGGFRFPWSKKK